MPLQTFRQRASVCSLLTTALIIAAPGSQAEDIHQAPDTATASDFIEVFEKLSGTHPGVRKGHARGVCAEGRFTPGEDARVRFDTPLFDQATPVVVRFSTGGGNPDADERASAPRGIGVKFMLDGESPHHIAGLTTPVFAGKNPQQFLGLLRLNHLIQQGEASAEDRERYLEENPEAARQGRWLQTHPPAAEYTAATYHGIHTFYAVDGEQAAQPFRWRLVPAAGEQLLTEEERATLPAAFLESRLQQRLAEEGSIDLHWQWVLADPEDPINDPSLQWPGDRETVSVGTLTLTGAGGEACEPINFDPNQLALGISPSDDPVLALRSAAYAISFGKRLSEQ